MKEIDFSTLKASDLKSHKEISIAYMWYLVFVLDYNYELAECVAAEEFYNPYLTDYFIQEYLTTCEIDGVTYEVRKCYLDFTLFGSSYCLGMPPFEFFMLFDKASMPDSTEDSYINARKMYLFDE